MSNIKIVEQILSKPIEHLVLREKRLPNIEVLRLYREVYKFAGKFYWNNERGQPWREALRKSARKEFDLSKQESDPILVMKMMVTTRKSMEELQEKLFSAQSKLI